MQRATRVGATNLEDRTGESQAAMPGMYSAGDAAGPLLSGEFRGSVTVKDDQRSKEDEP
jgi:hypothetical protein